MADRREFLTFAGASLLAAGAGVAAARAQEAQGATITQPNAPIPEASSGWQLAHRTGLGGVAIGNGMNRNSDEAAQAALETAWDGGIRFYDTAPFYGSGLSERRFGQFLTAKPREDYVVLSKVGRNLHPDASARVDWDDSVWKTPPHFRSEYDYTADGVRRSVEQILQRMHLPYLDIVLVHDLDAHNEEIRWEERFEECRTGAFPELTRMREEGLIRAWGLGVNNIEPITRCMEVADPDIHISAEQYSLIRHREAVERLLPEIRRRDNQLILGGVLNTGYLAGSPRYYYQEANATEETARTREALRAVAQRHGIDLRTAALQFALAPAEVDCVLFGARNGQQVRENIASLGVEIPSDFWAELKREGLVHEDAQTDYRRVTL